MAGQGEEKDIDLVRQLAFFLSGWKCQICGKASPRFVCATCRRDFFYLKPPFCPTCGIPIEDRSSLCFSCQKESPPFDLCRSVLSYGGRVRDAILKVKFRDNRFIAESLSDIMVDYFQRNRHLFPGRLITSVPPNQGRKKEQNLDLAEILTQKLAEKFDLKMKPLLKRIKKTLPQNKLSYQQRWENIKDAFILYPYTGEEIGGKDVILIDDIITSGATVWEMSKVLKKTQIKGLTVLTLSRTL